MCRNDNFVKYFVWIKYMVFLYPYIPLGALHYGSKIYIRKFIQPWMPVIHAFFWIKNKFLYERETRYRNICFFAIRCNHTIRGVCWVSRTKQKHNFPLRRDVNEFVFYIEYRYRGPCTCIPCSLHVHTTYSSSQWAKLSSQLRLFTI